MFAHLEAAESLLPADDNRQRIGDPRGAQTELDSVEVLCDDLVTLTQQAIAGKADGSLLGLEDLVASRSSARDQSSRG